MRGRRRTEDQAPNHDSFLDIVANLVGILIILVMVIGVRAKDAMVEAAISSTDDASAPVESNDSSVDLAERATLTAARTEVESLQKDILEMDQEKSQLQMLIDARRQQRNTLLTAISSVELELERLRDAQRSGDQADLEVLQQLASARAELGQMQQALTAMQGATTAPSVLAHYPTPLAQTVFGTEEHFRLQGGRITYVPLNEMVEMLKVDAADHVERLRQQPSVTETIGPAGGFRLRYTLQRRQVPIEGPLGPVTQDMVELSGFELLPVHDRLGEPIEMALADGSQLRQQLSQWDPDRVTVTIWTYPDSFGDYRQLKEALASQGYLTAARPLPEGHPISGSPQGTHSSAQ